MVAVMRPLWATHGCQKARVLLEYRGMKKDIHPQNYRPVLFIDNSNGAEFVISSTVNTDEKAKAKNGKEYPVYRLEISSASHPFYTGNEKILDTAGRVERFKNKMAAAKTKKKA
ncbi:MAG: 50S ribosomal protein L31 type B [Parcubacteria group bacterium Gr01-1014_46]|nr:MAG: 50S ribosomal protein L31 type B [Parcubacteria group bacterium Gr01-1014_46]